MYLTFWGEKYLIAHENYEQAEEEIDQNKKDSWDIGYLVSEALIEENDNT